MNDTERRIARAIETLRQLEAQITQHWNAARGVPPTQANIDNSVRIYCAQLELPL